MYYCKIEFWCSGSRGYWESTSRRGAGDIRGLVDQFIAAFGVVRVMTWSDPAEPVTTPLAHTGSQVEFPS